jgi:hypothetical protein
MNPESTCVQTEFMSCMRRASCAASVLCLAQEYSRCVGDDCPQVLSQALALWRNAVFDRARSCGSTDLLQRADLAAYLLHTSPEDGARCYAHITHWICDSEKQTQAAIAGDSACTSAGYERLLLGAASLLDNVMVN